MHIVPLLEPGECRHARKMVHALRPHWIPRAPVPFFTLGAATYMDVRGQRRDSYLTLAGTTNPLLSEHFGWLHDRVLAALAKLLGRKVVLAPGLAVPGFHMFLAHPAFLQPVASVHLDLQYLQHPWKDLGQPDFDDPISFTLPVALPEAGGGLRIWSQGLGDARRLETTELEALLNRQPPEHIPYTTGCMVVHTGHLVHQIAPAVRLAADDERITLQGHALRCDDVWYAYW